MIDQLIRAIREKANPTVVGLDPAMNMIPEGLKLEAFDRYGKTPKAAAESFLAFNRAIIDAVADIVPAVKPQIAMYERYGLDGLDTYLRTVAYAREKGLIVIGDVKRGDISSTAEAYAAHLGGTQVEGETYDLWKEDFITVNPYFGTDGIAPFVKAAAAMNRGLFVLVKTSNPSSSELQDLLVDGRPVYRLIADLVHRWGQDHIGAFGYSLVGAVVGATHPIQGVELRAQLPHTFFLVPGYGAQGGKGADLKGFFDKDGVGCIVNSSRGIIAAWRKDPEFADAPKLGIEFAAASRKAALAMRDDLRSAF